MPHARDYSKDKMNHTIHFNIPKVATINSLCNYLHSKGWTFFAIHPKSLLAVLQFNEWKYKWKCHPIQFSKQSSHLEGEMVSLDMIVSIPTNKNHNRYQFVSMFLVIKFKLAPEDKVSCLVSYRISMFCTQACGLCCHRNPAWLPWKDLGQARTILSSFHQTKVPSHN